MNKKMEIGFTHNETIKSASTSTKNYHNKIYNIANTLTEEQIPSFIGDLVQQSLTLIKTNDYNNASLCLINASSLLKSIEQTIHSTDQEFKVIISHNLAVCFQKYMCNIEINAS